MFTYKFKQLYAYIFALMKMTWRESVTIIIPSYIPGMHVFSNIVKEKYIIL